MIRSLSMIVITLTHTVVSPCPKTNLRCCDFCFNHDIPLFEGGFDSTTRICAFCATRALSEISPQPARARTAS